MTNRLKSDDMETIINNTSTKKCKAKKRPQWCRITDCNYCPYYVEVQSSLPFNLEEAAEEYAPDFSNSIASKAAVDAVRDAFKAGQNEVLENLQKYGLEKQGAQKHFTDEEMKELLRTEYEKGRADAIAEMKSTNITDEWIKDYWQHKKVNNPNSYDKGDEIQFDYQGFVSFCKKYCQKPIEWSEEDEKIKYEIKVILANTDFSRFALDYTFADMISWLRTVKQRIKGEQNYEFI